MIYNFIVSCIPAVLRMAVFLSFVYMHFGTCHHLLYGSALTLSGGFIPWIALLCLQCFDTVDWVGLCEWGTAQSAVLATPPAFSPQIRWFSSDIVRYINLVCYRKGMKSFLLLQ